LKAGRRKAEKDAIFVVLDPAIRANDLGITLQMDFGEIAE
jgi:hypothetical protein